MIHDKYFPEDCIPPRREPHPCPPPGPHHPTNTVPPDNCPPPRPYRSPIIGKPPFEHSGYCHPGAPVCPPPFNPYDTNCPNPVPVYHHHHHPPVPRPPEDLFVMKKQLNEILKNISEADIFKDKTTTGTTASVGGIEAGTNLDNLTFSEFIEKLLYPEDPSQTVYLTAADLENILTLVAFTGKYSDLLEKPESFDYIYPSKNEAGITQLKSDVINAIGGFEIGDSLEGMKMSEIIERLLCLKSSDIDKQYPTAFMPAKWISNIINIDSGTLSFDASLFTSSYGDNSSIINEYLSAESPESFFENEMVDKRYELYALAPVGTIESEWKYDCLIKLSNTDDNQNPQVTNPTWADVPSTLSWTFDPTGLDSTTKLGSLIKLSGSGITTNMMLVLVRKF